MFKQKKGEGSMAAPKGKSAVDAFSSTGANVGGRASGKTSSRVVDRNNEDTNQNIDE